MIRNLLQQALSVAGIRVVGTALSVCMTAAIARLYGPDILGVYAYCVAIMAIAAVPIANGWATLILRAVSAQGTLGPKSKMMARYGSAGAFLTTFFIGTISLYAIRFGGSSTANILAPIAMTSIGLLAIVMVSDQLSAIRSASIRGINRPSLAQTPETLVRPSIFLICIFLGWIFVKPGSLEKGLFIIFGSLALAAATSALFGQIVLQRIAGSIAPTTISPEERKSWIMSAAALASSAGLVQINGYIDLLILGAFVSSSEVGLYRAGLQIAMLASFGYVALNMLAGQRFSRLHSIKDHPNLNRTATYLARLALISAIPMPVIILFFGERIFSAIFGEYFSTAALPALIVACGFTFSAAIGMARTLLVMQGKEFLVMRTTLAALVINIALCWLLIPQYGIIGAACSNLAATVGWNALLWRIARISTGIDTSVFGLDVRNIKENG